MKKIYVLLLALICLMGFGLSFNSVEAVEQSVTYKQVYGANDTCTVKVDKGIAPVNSSASFKTTYTNANQLTKGKSMTLTLSGYNGYKINSLVLSMKSNSSKGAGTLSYTNGSNPEVYLVGTKDNGYKFNDSSWYSDWSTSYVNITKTFDEPINVDGDIVFKIAATDNSIYCQSFTINYELAEIKPTYNITFNNNGQSSTLESNTNGTINFPTVSEREGYTFVGWFDSNDKQYSSTDLAVEGLELTAKWTQNSTVSYVTYSTKLAQETNVNFKTFEPANITKPDRVFGGWYFDKYYTQPYVSGAELPVNTTLYAKWLKIEEVTDIVDGDYVIGYIGDGESRFYADDQALDVTKASIFTIKTSSDGFSIKLGDKYFTTGDGNSFVTSDTPVMWNYSTELGINREGRSISYNSNNNNVKKYIRPYNYDPSDPSEYPLANFYSLSTEINFETGEAFGSLRFDNGIESVPKIRFGGIIDSDVYNENNEYGIIVMTQKEYALCNNGINLELLNYLKENNYAKNAVGTPVASGQQMGWVFSLERDEINYTSTFYVCLYEVTSDGVVKTTAIKEYTVNGIIDAYLNNPSFGFDDNIIARLNQLKWIEGGNE